MASDPKQAILSHFSGGFEPFFEGFCGTLFPSLEEE